MTTVFKRVLLVEDDDAHAELIRRAFEGATDRFQLRHARSLREANDCLNSEPQHLVISDYRLPDGLGIELIDVAPDTTSLPVVMLTSQGSEAVAVEALKRGAIDYVVKSPAMFSDMPHVADRALRDWGYRADRDSALQQLRHQEERLRLVTNAVPALIGYVDRECRLRFVNAGFERWYHHPIDWFIGRTMQSVLGEEDYHLTEEPYAMVLAGSPVSFEGWFTLPKQGKRFVRKQYVPHVDDDGNVIGAYTLTTDITELKRAEDERTQLLEKLADRERLATIGMTAAMFAHEVGNPLNNMYLHAQILERQMKADGGEKFLDDLVGLKQEISRLSGLLKEFRSLAARQNGPLQEVELPKLLDGLLAMHVQPTDKIAVSVRYDPDLGPVPANENRLKQVFLNLIKNAIEAMPDGGQLGISTQMSGDEAVVEVTDSGAGIPDGMDVFEPFKSTKPTGTGLGLPIVRQTVGGFGGSVSVLTEVGRGCTFRVSLPLAAKQPSQR